MGLDLARWRLHVQRISSYGFEGPVPAVDQRWMLQFVAPRIRKMIDSIDRAGRRCPRSPFSPDHASDEALSRTGIGRFLPVSE